MLSILGFVFGWILRILGVFLLLILLIAAAVLLVPIRYEAEASYREKKPAAQVRVSWLLHFLSVKGAYDMDRGLVYRVKILGITVLDSQREKKPKKKKKKRDNKEKKDKDISKEPKRTAPEIEIRKAEEPERLAVSQEATVEVEIPSETPENKVPKGESEPESKEKNSQEDSSREDYQSHNPREENPEEETQSASSLFERICESALGLIESLSETFQGLAEKKEALQAKIGKILDFLQDPENQETFRFLIKQLKRLLTHIRPRTFRLTGRYGSGDPAQTGQVLGIVYMLYPIYGDSIQLAGDFEDQVMEGEMALKGRIRLGTLVQIGIQVVMNKQVRKWLRR